MVYNQTHGINLDSWYRLGLIVQNWTISKSRGGRPQVTLRQTAPIIPLKKWNKSINWSLRECAILTMTDPVRGAMQCSNSVPHISYESGPLTYPEEKKFPLPKWSPCPHVQGLPWALHSSSRRRSRKLLLLLYIQEQLKTWLFQWFVPFLVTPYTLHVTLDM